MFHHQFFQLENGFKVYLIENNLTPLVDIKVFYKVGTADDSRNEHGLSHFLEHLMFKGTEKFPKDMFDQLLARQGANYNAYTTQDLTAYTTTLAADQIELVLCLEADRMNNLNFTKEDVQKEREVVHEERAMRMDNNPFGPAQEEYLRTFYGNHPYGTPPIGYKEHIDAYTWESARAHYKKYYHPNNAFLVVTGHISMEKLKPLVQKYFGLLQKGESIQRKRMEEQISDSSITIKHKGERIKLTNIHMAYHAPNFKSEGKEHAMALLVLNQVLVGNELSRFYQKFVEDEKIATGVHGDYDHTSFDKGEFGLSMTLLQGMDPDQVVIKMKNALQEIVERGILEKELVQAKRDMLSEFAFIQDDITEPAHYFSALAVDFPVEEIEHMDRHINAVTLQQVQNAAHYVLSKDPAVILIILPETQGK